MGQLFRLTLLLAFVGLGLRIPFLLEPRARRRAIQLFLGYVLLVHGFVVASQVDCWPFSSHAMMANDTTRQPDEQAMIALRGVDSAGREWDVDPLAWSPLFTQSIRGWFEIVYPVVSEAEKRTAARYLFEKAEQARRARAAGHRLGNERLLGPVAAPDTYAYAPVRRTSDEPFVALRVYRVGWNRRDLLAGAIRADRQLLIEYREP